MNGVIQYFIAGLMAFPVVPQQNTMCNLFNNQLSAAAKVTSICPYGPLDIKNSLYNINYKTEQRVKAKEKNYAILCSNHKPGSRIPGLIFAFYTGDKPYPVTLIGTTPEVADMAAKFNDNKNKTTVKTIFGKKTLIKNIPSKVLYVYGKYYKFLWVGGRVFEYSKITPVVGKNMTNANTCEIKTGKVGA